MSRNVIKRTFRYVHPAQVQIHAGLSETSLGAPWTAKDAKFLLADNEDSD